MWWNILISALLVCPVAKCQRIDCSSSGYERCIAIADPLVKEPHLIFPDNLDDIDLVCRTWNRFVDCLKAYTENCFTDFQKREFNKAVASPIESVHQMCMQPSYQKEYLRYASCIKSTIIERDHCGPHYNLLVNQVEQGDTISKGTLCCSHDRFKACVQKETRRVCDQGVPDGPAYRFATQTIDKALRFLQEQCVNFILNHGDCTPILDAVTSYSDRSMDPKNVVSVSSEVYPWSTIQQSLNHQGHEREEQEEPAFHSRVPKVSTPNWLPSTMANYPSPQEQEITSRNSIGTENQHLGPRTRPSSYGRASSWPSEPSSTTTRSTQIYSVPQSVGNSPVPDYNGAGSTTGKITSANSEGGSSTPYTNKYGTVEVVPNPGTNSKSSASPTTPTPTQRPVMSSTTPFTTPVWYPTSSPETWYPAAGFQLNNEVDEPNQLGLIKQKNDAVTLISSFRILGVGFIVGYFWVFRIF